MLKYLCHESINDNKEIIKLKFLLLPKVLQNSINEFIKFQMAKEEL